LVEVFSIVEVGDRPPLGGKAGTKGEWTIGGLVLPVPGDIRRHPPDHINAVLTHTIHFVTLAFYLSIKLSFEIVWSRSTTPPTSPAKGSGLLGVGIPWIGAIQGGESGGWARYDSLRVSSSDFLLTSSPGNGPSQRPAPAVHLHLEHAPSPGSAFTTTLAMLIYDVCYLAHTQAVDVPVAHAGDVLGNLWAVCCLPELGCRSHATRPLLPPPIPPTFPLDFSQLLQATAAMYARVHARGQAGKRRAKLSGSSRRTKAGSATAATGSYLVAGM
ncbi:hypothetical protein OH77DRAFT_1414011, partial [Trametes cingulata]